MLDFAGTNTIDSRLPRRPAPLLSRVDLMPLEAMLCAGLRKFFPFGAHSFYFPHPDTYSGDEAPQPKYLPEEDKLLLPLLQDGGDFLGFFVARGVPEAVTEALPLLPQAAALCLDNLALYRQSRREPVSGLHNREALYEALGDNLEHLRGLLKPGRDLALAGASGQFCLLVIRLNGLAAIVREQGYLRADELLALLGKTLEAAQPQHAFASRSGDYELALLLPSCSVQACRELALRLTEELAQVNIRNSLTGRRLGVLPSAGYVNCPRDLHGLERRSADEQARHLLRRARLSAALASANLKPTALRGAVFEDGEQAPEPVMAYADILREGGRVLGVWPLSRLLVSLGATAGARVGQNFTIWGYAAREAAGRPVLSRRYKADIFLVEVGANESIAEVLHVDDPQFPPEAGDYLKLGVSDLYRGSQSAFYPDDVPEQQALAFTAARDDETEHFDLAEQEKAVQKSRAGNASLGYADFLPRWSLEREKYENFALVLGRFGLRRKGQLQQEVQAEALVEREDAPENIFGSVPESDGGWEGVMQQVAEKCRQHFGPELLLGRYALNSLIFFVPELEKAELGERLEQLGLELAQSFGVESAFGAAPHPFLDFHKSDSLENAKKSLDYAILLPPPHIGVLDTLALNISADRLCSLGDQLGAITEYRRALLCDPDNILAWNSLGVLLAGLGRHSEARQNLEEALGRDPDDLNTLYNLGSLHQSLGNHAEAGEYYERCLKLEPENVFAIYRLGQIAEENKDLQEAEEHYRRAVTLPGGAALTRRSLARLYIKKGDLQEAREELHEALLVNPHDALSLQLLAGLYLDAGEDPAVAESLARQSVSLRPDLRVSWLELARAMEAGGKKAEAREALIKAGEL